MNMQTLLTARAIQKAVSLNPSTSTTGQSASQPSDSWRLFGGAWAIRPERLIMLANIAGYSKVQVWLDTGLVVDIEVHNDRGQAVFEILLAGKELPQSEIVNISVATL